MKKKVSGVVLGIIGILIGVFMFFSLDYLVNDREIEDPAKRRAKIVDKYDFNQHGLPLGLDLSEVAFFEDENFVFYTDRVLRRSKYKEDQVEIQEKILLELSKIIPRGINSYILPISGRIVWEDDYLEDVETYKNFMEEIKSIVPRDMEFVDILQILRDHRNENLFFRTEDGWTARGAYYGSELLLNHMGLDIIPLEDYDEHLYSRFEGLDRVELIKKYGTNEIIINKLNEIPLEPNCYYLFPNSKNIVKRTKISKGSRITENVKIVSKVRKGQSSILGSSYLYAVAEGEGISEEKGEKTILLLSDLSGHMLVPYLLTYYKNVYVVNILNHEYDYEQFQTIFNEYDISDIILIQKGEDMGNLSKNKFFKGLLNAEK